MPGRLVPLINDQIYHILNRGISEQIVFGGKKDYDRATEILRYYKNINQPLRYSQFKALANERRQKILENLEKEKSFLVEIIAYCLMPNHFHLLLKQIEENGISKFISNFSNSLTRYFNVKNKRKGPLFQGKFQAIRVENDNQLLHLSRYIHLNPYSSFLIKSFKELEDYPYSSLPEYLGKTPTSICVKEVVLDQFKNIEAYKNFVLNQADYQRELQTIKNLALED